MAQNMSEVWRQPEPEGDPIFPKLISMLVLGVGSFILGLIPIKLSRVAEKNLFLSLLLCFGGGVLLYTTFIHLQPEVRASMNKLPLNETFPFITSKVPLSELVFCFGFFFVYLVEEAVHLVLDKKTKNDNDAFHLHRSLSVKCLTNNGNNNATLTIPRVNIVNTNGSWKNEENGAHIDSLAISSTSDDSHSNDHTVDFSNSFHGLLAVLALSFHAIFEGLAVGLENVVENVWYLFGAIATHKLVIAFCVGVELVSSKTKLPLLILYVGTFALVTPLGIGIGIALSKTGNPQMDVTSVVLQGMAAGTLLYVVFFEVLARERANKHNGVCQLFAILLGFLLMFAMQLIIPHSHKHENRR